MESRIDRLEAEEARRRERLDELEREIADAEKRLETARKDAAYHECRALDAKIEAGVRIKRLECAKAFANWAQCRAKNEANTAKGVASGCVLGILAAFVSGGAAAPYAAAGCGGGFAVGEAKKEECGGRPSCIEEQDFERIVLREHGLRARPRCVRGGGMAGPGFASNKASRRRTVARAERRDCSAFVLRRVEASVPRSKKSGAPWDVGDPAPDVQVKLFVRRGKVWQSPKRSGYALSFDVTSGVRLFPGDAVEVRVVDRDLMSDDRIAVLSTAIPSTRPSVPLTLGNGRTTVRLHLECPVTP